MLVCLQAHSFQLEEDLSSYGNYVRAGIVTQHKVPKTVSFRTLEAALSEPGEFLLTDFSKIERPGVLHIGFQALDAFQVRMPGILPNCTAVHARQAGVC